MFTIRLVQWLGGSSKPKKERKKERNLLEQIELQAKLLNYFLGSNKSNINQSKDWSGGFMTARPGLDHNTSPPWFEATCPCSTAFSSSSCLRQQKKLDTPEVSTSRGGSWANCLIPWLTREIVQTGSFWKG